MERSVMTVILNGAQRNEGSPDFKQPASSYFLPTNRGFHYVLTPCPSPKKGEGRSGAPDTFKVLETLKGFFLPP
jgi:hypothetical protein